MSDMATSKDTGPFWARVRTALSAIRPDREHKLVYGQAAIARSIGMKPKLGPLIEEELAMGWRLSGLRNVSLSLLVIEVDRFDDYVAVYGPEEADAMVQDVLGAITAARPREGDNVLRLGRNSFVIVLPDLPVLMARAAAVKMGAAIRKCAIPHRDSHAGSVSVSMGLAVANPEANYDRTFFEAAAEALKKAQRRGLGRIEMMDLRPGQERRRQRLAA